MAEITLRSTAGLLWRDSRKVAGWGMVALLTGKATNMLEPLGIEFAFPPWVAWVFCLLILAGSILLAYRRLHVKHVELEDKSAELQRLLYDKRLTEDQRERVQRLKLVAGQIISEMWRGLAADRQHIRTLLEQIKVEAGGLAEFGLVTPWAMLFRVGVINWLAASPDEELRNKTLDSMKRHYDQMIMLCNDLLSEHSSSVNPPKPPVAPASPRASE